MILTLVNLSFSLATPLVLVVALGYIAIRHQRLFLALFMVLTALESTRDFTPSLGLTFSGLSIYPEDLVMAISGFAALAGIGRWRLRSVARTAFIIVTVLVGGGLINWISTFGLQFGTNSWRLELLVLALLMYTTTRPRPWSWEDLQVIIVASAIIVALASVVGILLYGFGSSSSTLMVSGGALYDSRPVSAPGSLLMLMGLWVSVLYAGKWSLRRFLAVVLLGSMVLLTENRSVWVAAIFGVAVWWLAPKIGPRGTSGGLGSTSRTVLVILGATATALIGLSVAAVGQSATADGTWLWRVTRWAESMSIPRSWIEWLVGSVLGPTPASTPTIFATTAHSLYVNGIEMTGFIGLGAMVYLLIAVRKAQVPLSTTPLGQVVCFSFLGFGLAYSLPPWAWMFAGILLASNQAASKDEERSPIHEKAHEEVPL